MMKYISELSKILSELFSLVLIVKSIWVTIFSLDKQVWSMQIVSDEKQIFVKVRVFLFSWYSYILFL
jgi:hypothetical protein